MTTTDKLPPVHPGEILMKDFLKGMGFTQHKLAVSIGVPPRRINEIVHGKRAVTADTALRLAKFFEMSPQFWLGLQAQYDLDVAEDKILSEIERIQLVQAVSA
ncbi:HigA family addiction module antidote protein [Corynebacterium aurimucosum]|uniref:HigA family addiction module antidote protein n=1 Tax=Corynebacterium aurimucosum TaxID=169292 RepID=A0A558IL75_9CORY|nr:HigA family addiction module antitoxin [Corynebacterium aurimucosum]TVU82096.1 HigA family addiction module antidote protein [Corynebacterium aurimucosum]